MDPPVDLRKAASLPAGDVLRELGTSPAGLSSAEARTRLGEYGRNEIEETRVSPLDVLARQFKNPFLILLIVTALLSLLLGDKSDAAIILVIIFLSVGLSFAN